MTPTNTARQNIEKWLTGNFDIPTKNAIRNLEKENIAELNDAFHTKLTFGTGGLRGIMGIGTNRINKYTIGFATQGLANYLKKYYPDTQTIKVAIAYDSRHQSSVFAQQTAEIFSANNIFVYLFSSLRPTPELSFTIRHLGCHSGVVITASHNPKEYNGYKVYWKDGGQIVTPHDKGIIEEILPLDHPDQIQWKARKNLIQYIDKDIDTIYSDTICKEIAIPPNQIPTDKNIKIVYTPIHGTGIQLIPDLLRKIGFTNIYIPKQQATPDGDFPSVLYPNPEETEAMQIGLETAKQRNADILLGTDPDTDRLGIGIKNNDEKWILLNGNQTAALLFDYILHTYAMNIPQKKNPFVAKTIVTTDLLEKIAAAYHIPCYNVLTGFKWIADLIASKEGKETFLIGGEESYGILVSDFVRDKDAVSATAAFCLLAAYHKKQNRTLFTVLENLYRKYGFFYETIHSLTRKGIDGAKEIQKMMRTFRNTPPKILDRKKVIIVSDYRTRIQYNSINNTQKNISLPAADVLQFVLENGSKISVRPSGTEPKIKFYLSLQDDYTKYDSYATAQHDATAKSNRILNDLGIRK